MPVIKAPDLNHHPKYWAECFGTADFLPTTRAEMDALGWDSCDIIIISGDAYVDHPSFGAAIIGRLLESQGFRVGIIDQPKWDDTREFQKLGKPNLYFGISAGNMDSMINRYTADLKLRHDDAYTPGNVGGKRPDRAVTVYAQRCRAAYREVPIVIGGIESSLRRIAQFDYWSDQVKRSVLVDSGADILLYGNAERAIVDVSHMFAKGQTVEDMRFVKGTAVMLDAAPIEYVQLDSTRIDWPGKIDLINSPYDMGKDKYTPANEEDFNEQQDAEFQAIRMVPAPLKKQANLDKDEQLCIRLPSFDKIKNDPILYAHASRILHQESNPHNAKPLIQKHGNKEIWVNTPPIPLETYEMDAVFDLYYARVPHPKYDGQKIPAYDMIKTSINIMRGCFGGCTFCSITEHEGRVIQSRSQDSVLREIEDMKAKVPNFTGQISDLGGPTANMYHLNCKSQEIQSTCRRLSCVFPSICSNLKTDHSETTSLYRKARAVPGIKNIAIASGLRYDLAVRDPEYVKELVTHHVGGYLKIAPEHSEERTLNMMMKPTMETYHQFEKMFNKYSKAAGKKQYLIPYFIAAHPGCEDEDMMNLALWLKKNKFRLDQVQTFYPSPMSLATAMYHSGRNPLKRLSYKKENRITITKDISSRRVHKAYIRFHDEKSWDTLRESLRSMGRTDLIGHGENCLVPPEEKGRANNRFNSKKSFGSSTPKSGSKPAGNNTKFSAKGKMNKKTSGKKRKVSIKKMQ